jgi:hypothetical protein
MATPIYSATLHHLAPDATAAGLAYPDEQLPAVSPTQLRELLFALSEVAAHLTIYEPSSPEIRIKTDRDVFVVRTRNRQLCFVGWESILRGEAHSVSYILTSITGSAGTTSTTDTAKAAPRIERAFTPTHSAPPMPAGSMPRWIKITLMAILIIGFNATTVWLLMRPTHAPVPKHELLAETESHTLLTKVAGEYQTGNKPGDRRLIIDADGTLRLAKYGPQQSATEERTKAVRGALVEGRAALITSDPAVLVLKDADTVVLYGTTYHRHSH